MLPLLGEQTCIYKLGPIPLNLQKDQQTTSIVSWMAKNKSYCIIMLKCNITFFHNVSYIHWQLRSSVRNRRLWSTYENTIVAPLKCYSRHVGLIPFRWRHNVTFQASQLIPTKSNHTSGLVSYESVWMAERNYFVTSGSRRGSRCMPLRRPPPRSAV